MGLDWHATGVIRTKKEKAKLVPIFREKYGVNDDIGDEKVIESIPDYKDPCEQLKAPKLKDRDSFKDHVKEELTKCKARALKAKEEYKNGKDSIDIDYVNNILNITEEEFSLEIADSIDCHNCKLFQDLNGIDCMNSMLLGVTQGPCDFRGKRISHLNNMDDDLADEAYRTHSGKELLEYADKLENWLLEHKELGEFVKPSYEEYSTDYDHKRAELPEHVANIVLGEKMDREEFESTMHHDERNIRQAVHWLRTLHKHGLVMTTNY